MSSIPFDVAFEKLTGNPPFPWQEALYGEFIAAEIPDACILPTGLGKTSVLAIWLLALANESKKVPRRLVYVVNRRTVVDQSTAEAEKLRENLKNVTGLRESLLDLCAIKTEEPLAISTLRGQFADNGEWRNDPARPAIIAGTVDMIGSRLLFSGYGAGFKTKPLYAGFLGCRALLVHDEAHLEPAFQETLNAIVNEQKKCEDGQFRVMELTATTRRPEGRIFRLTDDDREKDETVKKRLGAKKTVHLHPTEEKKIVEKLIELEERHKDSGKAILVFASRVEAVEAIVKKLGKNAHPLTGTMRGLERDRLARCNPIFARFLPERERKVPAQEGTVYLVCTSAGEVGVNISADHLVCDLTTFDSMAQRFGRVNRFGDGDARIDVVHPLTFDTGHKSFGPLEQQRERTLSLLQTLPEASASPGTLDDLVSEMKQAAYSPTPDIPATSDILFDAWSMTTIRDRLPGRPPVADWLHGRAEWEPPRTTIVWRTEVGLFTDEIRERYRPKDLLEDYPLKPHELLSDQSKRVFGRMKKLAGRNPGLLAWLLDDEGDVQVMKLGDVAARDEDLIAGRTVVLPSKAGGLKDGLFTDGDFDPDELYDVADEWGDGSLRKRTWDGGTEPGMRLVKELYPKEVEEEGELEVWRWYVKPADADDENGSRFSLKATREEQLLAPHNERVGKIAGDLAAQVGEDERIVKALRLAGLNHDPGKARPLWQRSIGNHDPNKTLAKSGASTKGPRWRTKYRHEFGSLLDLQTAKKADDLDPEMRDLVLHLIAAHHGRARPHFAPDEAFDPNYSEKVAGELAVEVPKRFARLQQKYGRWRLAFLESLLRAADYLASEEAES